MTTIEILAVILAAVVLLKIVVILINPRVWMKLVDPIYRNSGISTVVFAALAIVVGYYLLPSISIAEIGAVAMFFSLLMGVSMLPYSQTLLKLREEVMVIGIRKAWLSIIIWAVFAVWILYAVFF